ncbi:MAG: HEAT repeat domain-containing protein, partial [Planctomycetes bacterium]|nr:HEAT repeat domain-containing protein [Planctomycetota bacterium]
MDTQPKTGGDGANNVLGIVIVGVVLGIFVIVGVAGFFAVKYVVESRKEDPTKAEPLTENELIHLQEHGEKAAGEIPRILACFEKNDEYLRMQAAETLGKIGAKAVDPVREKLKSKDANVRYYAALSLALIGADAAPAADDLVGLLGDGDARVRAKVIYA